EVGIRALTVTGVQTCALPISGIRGAGGSPGGRGGSARSADRARRTLPSSTEQVVLGDAPQRRDPVLPTDLLALFVGPAVVADARSEERRVGQGGDHVWVSIHA